MGGHQALCISYLSKPLNRSRLKCYTYRHGNHDEVIHRTVITQCLKSVLVTRLIAAGISLWSHAICRYKCKQMVPYVSACDVKRT